MQLKLTDQNAHSLNTAANSCGLPPEKLARLFVIQGLEMYCRHDDELRELRETLDGETE